MLRNTFLLLFITSFSLHVSGQTRIINQLKQEISVAATPGIKLQQILALCDQRQSMSADTLYKYASMAKEISLTQNNIFNIALAEFNMANYLVKKGLLDTALKICDKNILLIADKKGSAEALMKLTGLKAQILIKSGKYKEGLTEIYTVLRLAEKNNDIPMQIVAKNGIGWINMEMDQPSEALKWFFKALSTTDNKMYHEKNCNIYSNIAAIYKQLNQNDSAEYYIKIAIDFSRKIENLFFQANSLAILADIFIATKRSAFAEAPLNEALKIRKQIGDPFYIVSDMSQLAIYYASVNDTVKGKEISMEGIKMAQELNIYSKLPYLYFALGENYKAAGNYLQYSKTLQDIMALKDSMYTATSAEVKANMETHYQLEEKENLIARQKLEIVNKNFLFYGSIVFLFLITVMAWLFFAGYKKNQQIKLLKIQGEQKQAEAIAVRSAEENERKRISRDLHDNLGAYASVLMANTELLQKQAIEYGIEKSIEGVADNAQNIIGSLQETIWVLNNDVITITDFIDRFKLYARKMMENFKQVNITFDEIIATDIILSPAEALNIFRIMQEALQNILKHSQPQNISVSVLSSTTIIISIKDDGRGFNKNNIKHGNGLYNMEHRAKDAGYRLNILSNDAGTEVSLQKNITLAV